MLRINNMSIHHIGYAVEDIEKAYEVFLLMGYKNWGGGTGSVVEDFD
jgi:hypothetical protein